MSITPEESAKEIFIEKPERNENYFDVCGCANFLLRRVGGCQPLAPAKKSGSPPTFHPANLA